MECKRVSKDIESNDHSKKRPSFLQYIFAHVTVNQRSRMRFPWIIHCIGHRFCQCPYYHIKMALALYKASIS